MSKTKVKEVLLDIEIAYHNWLKKLNEINGNTRYQQKPPSLGASSAGLCNLKHYFKLKGAHKIPSTYKDMSKMRLGTLVHEDIQQALQYYFDGKVMSEISIQYNKVKGHLDVVVEIDKDTCVLIDIKTMNAYGWSKKYGRNKLPDTATWNKMQVATYALGLVSCYGYKTVHMYLLNYSKNTSLMRFEPVSDEYIDRAIEYWENLDTLLEKWLRTKPEDMKWNNIQAPMHKWECKYCEYSMYCPKEIKKNGK